MSNPDPLEPIELRVLGALIEKELTTPEYYPLSLNSLLSACNQKSNRHPVMNLTQTAVDVALSCLRQSNMINKVSADDARVIKYRETWTETENLTRAETAVMAVLMLRGPQTIGELRGRTGRMYDFKDLAQVERTLEALENGPNRERPLVAKLPRQTGLKESRYTHLLGAAGAIEDDEDADVEGGPSIQEIISRLQVEIHGLRTELNTLKDEVQILREDMVEKEIN